jgi:hypothetical protein
MLSPLADHDPVELADLVREAPELTAALLREVVAKACQRVTLIRQDGRSARIERLIAAGATADAALALVGLELPNWQVRRLAYDGGEWHCALSRERELPDWLDQAVEARHADLALAIVSAFIEARQALSPASRPSVPAVGQKAPLQCIPMCCDNFA